MVLPIAETLVLASGGTLIVVSLELWADGIVLHTVEPVRTRGILRGTTPTRPNWIITDDTGTEYEPALFAAGRWLSGRLRRTFCFVPPPPTEATKFRLQREGAEPGQEITIEIPPGRRP